MRRLSTILIFIAFVVPFNQSFAADDAATKAEIEAAIKALNDAYAGGDETTIASMVTPDHMGVSSYSGAQTFKEQFTTLGEFQARYFDYSPMSFASLGPDAVLVTYENSYEGTFAGKPLPSRIFVSQIWLRQDGMWRQQLYQETPLPAE
jgi:ketosteroid isomerase-like protein